MTSPIIPADAAHMVTQGVVALRARPSNESEQVSQQWLGCRVQALHEEKGWTYVQSDDAYRGWVDARFLAPHSDAPLTTITAAFAEVRQGREPDSPLVARLPMFARVHVIGEEDDMRQVVLTGGDRGGYVAAATLAPLPTVTAPDIAAHAVACGRELLGTPYLWGGSTPYGIDCSGFTQWTYRRNGLILRRDAHMQRTDPRFAAVPLDDPRPGDLIFFGKPEKITHVGMALADGTFTHSAGGSGVIITPVGDDRYWPRRVDARRLTTAHAGDAITPMPVPHEPEGR